MLTSDHRLLIAVAEDPVSLKANGQELCMDPHMCNRHGLITGATGTGKTISLQCMAESFSAMGIPVLLTDVKGDLSGISQAGAPTGSIARRIEELRLRQRGYENRSYPVCFWDVAGEQGHSLRATISDMGPVLLSRLLELNDIQSGALNSIFHIADDNGLLLLDLKDLRSMVAWVAEHRTEYTAQYGSMASASIGAIQRGLLRLEDEGGTSFFGEPSLNIEHLFRIDAAGRGYLNIIAADRLMQKPRLYAAVLLWLLSELYEQLPESGDLDKPRLILMFDEAHLLFKNMPAALLEKIEQVVRLIRSKGVGLYFITQNPGDLPESILSQLGNRIQHALRAFTPRDQKAVRTAAKTFRPNPAICIEQVISELKTGEALVSFLDNKGAPCMTERAFILPPEGGIGAVSPDIRAAVIHSSPMGHIYDQVIDRESAYEILEKYEERRQRESDAAMQEKLKLKEENTFRKAQLEAERLHRSEMREARLKEKEIRQKVKDEQSPWENLLETATRQVARTVTHSIGREIGRVILRGVLGGIFGGRR